MPRPGLERAAANLTAPPPAPQPSPPAPLVKPAAPSDVPELERRARIRQAIVPAAPSSPPNADVALREIAPPGAIPSQPLRDAAAVKPPGRPRATTARTRPDSVTSTAQAIEDYAAPRYAPGSSPNPLPDYPRQARREGWEGRVVLSVAVAVHGHATSVAVRQTSGYAILDEAALAAVRRWRFEPARRGGVPVTASVDVPIRFRLDDHE